MKDDTIVEVRKPQTDEEKATVARANILRAALIELAQGLGYEPREAYEAFMFDAALMALNAGVPQDVAIRSYADIVKGVAMVHAREQN